VSLTHIMFIVIKWFLHLKVVLKKIIDLPYPSEIPTSSRLGYDAYSGQSFRNFLDVNLVISFFIRTKYSQAPCVTIIEIQIKLV